MREPLPPRPLSVDTEYVTLRATREEMDLLTRIVGHHVGGRKLDRFYSDELYPNSPDSEAKGPLSATRHPEDDRPMVSIP